MKHLERVFDGRNHWLSYVVAILLIFIFSNIAIILFLYLYSLVFSDYMFQDLLHMVNLSRTPSLESFLLFMFPMLISFFIAVGVVKYFHGRTMVEIFNGTQYIRWNKIIYGAIVWFAIMFLLTVVDKIFYPELYILNNVNTLSFVLLLLLSLILLPFQVGFEEFLFRGYLTQGFAYWTRSRIVAIIIPAILFGLLHFLNPEVEQYGFVIAMSHYIVFGIIFGIITILDDGIELAVGAHFANNFFLSLFITHESSVIQTQAIFLIKEIDPFKDLILLIIGGIGFIIVLHRMYKWDFLIIFKKVENTEIRADI